MLEISVKESKYQFDVKTLRVSDIVPNPNQPRKKFGSVAMKQLTDSIVKHKGVIVPLWVFSIGEKYRLIDGERRWRCLNGLNEEWSQTVNCFATMQKVPEDHYISLLNAIQQLQVDWDSEEKYYFINDTVENFGVEKTAEMFNKSTEFVSRVVEICRMSRRIDRVAPLKYSRELVKLITKCNVDNELLQLLIDKINDYKIRTHGDLKEIPRIMQHEKAKAIFLKRSSAFEEAYKYIFFEELLEKINLEKYSGKEVDVVKENIKAIIRGG